jgi:hypothetical protein
LKNGELPDLSAVHFPRFTIRMDHGGRETEEIAFTDLSVVQAGVTAGLIVLYCVSKDRRFHIAFGLDVANERLTVQPDRGTQIVDDGSPETIDHAIMRTRFFRAMLLNGRTEVYDADTGRRLGRTDAFLASNIDLSASIDNLDRVISEMREERARRAHSA